MPVKLKNLHRRMELILMCILSRWTNSPVPGFLRQLIHGWSDTQLRLFLRLVTAKCAIPPGGFRPPLSIKPISAAGGQLRSHTCFHTLGLPRFATLEECAATMEVALLAADSELAD